MKLTEEKLETIKRALKQGLEYKAISGLTGISPGTISTIAITLGMRRCREQK